VSEDFSAKDGKIKRTKDHSAGRGIIVPISIHVKTSDLEDTGDSATATRPDVAEEEGTKTDVCRKVCLSDARSEVEMSAFDGVTATGKIGCHTVCWPVYVAPIQDSGFIGFDVFVSLHCHL
jgi:hypothetical protein